MYKVLASKIKLSNKLPERARRYEFFRQILLGTVYDNQEYQFHQERTDRKEHIPIAQRAPVVDVGLGLIRNTVDTSIGFVFGEGRYPEIDCVDEIKRINLLDMIKETNLFAVMQESMFWGSIGSSAIHVACSKNNRIHFKVYESQYLTPTWDADEPDQLASITEKYITTATELNARGYNIQPKTPMEQYWFQRSWDLNNELWFVPWPVTFDNNERPPVIDESRSIAHNLGFVPWVWLKNLKGGDAIDGASTFQGAIKSAIEIDFLISQGDRGLKYQADPTLVIVNPQASDEDIFRSAASAIVLGKDGKAEILEMKGTGHQAVLDQVRALRESCLEAMCGNRSTPDKIHSTQSGIALEHLWMPMILLAGDLRNNYGEKGLLELLNMVIKIGSSRQLRIMQKLIPLMNAEPVALRWGRYFDPTLNDLSIQSVTLKTLMEAGLLSRETGVKVLANEYAIEDVEDEIAQILVDEAAQDAREIKLAAATQVKANQN